MAVMMSARVVVVMSTALVFGNPLAVEPGAGQVFDGDPGGSGTDDDARMRKERQRVPPDAVGDHDLRARFLQQAREKARRIRRRRHSPDAEDFMFRRVGFRNCELVAATKMFVQTAFDGGNGNDHRRG